MMREPTMTPLTVAEQTEILLAGDWMETFVMAWKIVLKRHGKDWDTETSIDPTEYVMPEASWTWVCNVLMERTRTDESLDAVEAVSGALEWMNRGPSAA